MLGAPMKAIRFEKTGGPEVLRLAEIELGLPGPGFIRVRHKAIGLNFIDTYHRSGLYAVQLPSGLGLEAAGIVEAVGEGVARFKPGERIAYCTGPLGAYAEANNVAASRAVSLPAEVDFETAAAGLLKGMTAQYLLKRTYPVKAGETILVHAAAGGVGLILCQWAKALGARVLGTAGSQEKAALARANGCDEVILYRTEDVAKRVRDLTNGAGVSVVYDGVGKSTFMASLDSLRPRGLLASFGNASGPVTGVDLGVLAAKGSLYVTRPTLFHYTGSTEELDETARDVFAILSSGRVKVEIGQHYPLSEAARAHRELEARATIGASILLP
jgi:NADPH2:quinone reductase